MKKYNVFVEFGPFEVGEVEANSEEEALSLGQDLIVDDSEQFLEDPTYFVEEIPSVGDE